MRVLKQLSLGLLFGLALTGCQETGASKDAPIAATNKIDHDVTPQMELESAARMNKMAYKGTSTDLEKRPVTFGIPGASKAQYILFVKDGCPCSVDAQPLFNRLMTQYPGKLDVAVVTDATPEKAAKYAEQFKVKVPVISDREQKIVKGFGVKAATYSVLVARNGHIIKMWPGYSVDLMQDMNGKMAQAAGTEVRPFDPAYAPKAKKSGCDFAN